MTHTPLKQRSAREQEAAGVVIPYWHEDFDKPVQWHMKIMLLTPEELDKLVLICRRRAAELSPNPNDNRDGNLDYPPTNRERTDVVRHCLINRTERTLGTLAGYSNSFDNLLSKIERKGIDVARRQLELRRFVLSLIAEHYPYLKPECEYQLWLAESGLKKGKSQ